MNLSYSFYLSAANLRQRKLRSFLTMGGMAVGVSLITFLVSLGFGLQRLIQSQITNVEALTVLDVSRGESSLLEISDQVVTGFKNIDNVQAVSPSISLSGQVARENQLTEVAIYGVAPKYLDLEGVRLTSGQDFSAEDAKEVIITSTALNLIGLESNPSTIGQEVTLKVMVPKKLKDTSQDSELVPTDIPMKIAGIVKDDELTVVYVPLSVLQGLGFPATYTEAKVRVGQTNLKNDQKYSVAKVKVTDKSKLPEVRKAIEEQGYQVSSVADTVGQVDKIFLVFQLIVGGFGAIALFVASIGALNTLTVSLLERTREIGLMKAYGATSADIYRLFLSEAMTMGVLGGVVGVGIGIGSGVGANAATRYLAHRLGGQPVDIFYTPWQFILIIVAVVAVISLITGFYPARRAGMIEVLEALRNT